MKTNRKPKNGGVNGKPALDWWIADDSWDSVILLEEIESTTS